MSSKPTSRSWGGHTFVETVALLGLVLLMSALVINIFSGNQQWSERHRRLSGLTASLLALADQVPQEVLRVRPQPWASSSQFAEQGNMLSVGGWEGEKDRTIRFTSDQGRWLTMQGDDKTQFRWGPFDRANWNFWKVNSRVVGIEAHVTLGDETLDLHWPWGSEPW